MQWDNRLIYYKKGSLECGTPDRTYAGVKPHPTKLVSIYPNPASTRIFLDNVADTNLENISIFNALGAEVMKFGIPTPSIDVSTLENGIYFIQLTINGTLLTKMIIKE